jgi:4-amino-4-deoxy-L-arabinose transferase-like glycosyltransferase
MEAAEALGRSARPSFTETIREWVGSRSRAFWIVAGLTLLGAALRFATLGTQSLHHDEIVTAGRILGGGFGAAMEGVRDSESAPPLYYALAWGWTQLVGTGEFGLRSLSALAGVATVPVAYLFAAELRGRRAGIFAAALVAVNPMLLWYSQEARGYALLAFLCAASALYFVRALERDEGRDLIWWGVFSALALATHYFAIFPVAVEAVWLLARRGRTAARGIWIVALAGLALAPLALHQMAAGHAEWIAGHALGHRVWESGATFLVGETGDVIARPEHPLPALVPFLLVVVAIGLIGARGTGEERRAARLPLALAAAAFLIPLVLAIVAPGKDYVLARNLLPALVPLLVAVAIGGTLGGARRAGLVVGAALFAYSLGFSVLASVSPALQRPDWEAVAEKLGEPARPRAIVSWTLGQASLRHYLGTHAFQVVQSERYPWFVHEIDFVSIGPAPPVPRSRLAPGFRQVEYAPVGELYLHRYVLPGPDLTHLRLREARGADLNFGSNGVLVDGVGPGW